MRSEWAPCPVQGVDVMALPLSPTQGIVLSRLNGRTSLADLAHLTGLPRPVLEETVSQLVTLGAVQPAPEEAGEAHPELPADSDLAKEAEPDDPEAQAREPTYRALFETRLHDMPHEQRIVEARTASEPELSAYCFDPVPGVIQSLLHNPKCGLSQARLIARHHRNPMGLDALCERAAFAADLGVRRWLVRNPQLSVGLARRLYQGRRLMEHFKLAQDRDVPEGTRRTMRELLRARFTSAAAEERVEVILKTDGRSLTMLSGLPVDGKTTALLCGRPYSSTTLIQNIARWTAAPPALIAHLLKQESVRRQPTLRTLLLRHPNAPSSAP